MANYYVSSLASGGGVGSEGDPFTIVEGFAKADYTNNDKVWIKAGTYATTTDLDVSHQRVFFMGYSSSIGDLDDETDYTQFPLIQPANGAGVVDAISDNGNYATYFANLRVDGTYVSGSCFRCSQQSRVVNCRSENSGGNYGFHLNNGCMIVGSSSDSDPVGYYLGIAYGCSVDGSTSYGFQQLQACISCTGYNTGADCFWNVNMTVGCSVSGATGSAFETCSAINCIAENSTGNNYDGSDKSLIAYNCNSFNGGSADNSSIYFVNKNTDDPALTDPSTGDFSLGNSNLFGLGAYVGSLNGTGVLDLGAIQKSGGAGASPTTPTFDGITGLERIAQGQLKASWSAGANVTGYKIFVRKGSAPTFTDDTYLWGIVDDGSTSVIISTEEDNDTLLYGDSAIYVGVRGFNVGTSAEDAGTTTANLTPTGGLMLNDQVIQVLKVN